MPVIASFAMLPQYRLREYHGLQAQTLPFPKIIPELLEDESFLLMRRFVFEANFRPKFPAQSMENLFRLNLSEKDNQSYAQELLSCYKKTPDLYKDRMN